MLAPALEAMMRLKEQPNLLSERGPLLSFLHGAIILSENAISREQPTRKESFFGPSLAKSRSTEGYLMAKKDLCNSDAVISQTR